jgi:hypothetical protein
MHHAKENRKAREENTLWAEFPFKTQRELEWELAVRYS